MTGKPKKSEPSSELGSRRRSKKHVISNELRLDRILSEGQKVAQLLRRKEMHQTISKALATGCG